MHSKRFIVNISLHNRPYHYIVICKSRGTAATSWGSIFRYKLFVCSKKIKKTSHLNYKCNL